MCVPLLQGASIPAQNNDEVDQHTLVFSLKEEKGALRKALTPYEVRLIKERHGVEYTPSYVVHELVCCGQGSYNGNLPYNYSPPLPHNTYDSLPINYIVNTLLLWQ